MISYRVFSLICGFTLLAASCLMSGEAAAAGGKRYDRSVVEYTMPDVTLINQERQEVKLLEIIQSGKPVLVDFIYGTCTTICPILSAGFSNMQKKLGPDLDKVHFVSISIDPEYDTPEVMREYLDRYYARPGWDFLTGSRKDIDAVMRAFDAYVPNKMNHYPLTFIQMPGRNQWVRIYGMISTADLMAEYDKVVKANKEP